MRSYKFLSTDVTKNTPSYCIITFTVRQVMRGLDFSSRGKNLYDRIISLIEEVWAHKASLTPLSTKTKDCATRTLLKTGGELRCSGKVSSSCSTCATRRVAFWQAQLLRRWFQSRYPPDMLKFSNINPGPDGGHMWSRSCLPFRSTWVPPRFFVGFVLRNL
jgi:hypothetical protein